MLVGARNRGPNPTRDEGLGATTKAPPAWQQQVEPVSQHSPVIFVNAARPISPPGPGASGPPCSPRCRLVSRAPIRGRRGRCGPARAPDAGARWGSPEFLDRLVMGFPRQPSPPQATKPARGD